MLILTRNNQSFFPESPTVGSSACFGYVRLQHILYAVASLDQTAAASARITALQKTYATVSTGRDCILYNHIGVINQC